MVTATRPLRGHDLDFARASVGLGRRLIRLGAYLLLAFDVARERRSLQRMDARTLKDIGLSRADALREADRGFWDVPEHRMPKH